MLFLHIDSLNRKGEFQTFCLGNVDLNVAFAFINYLIQKGCHLISLKLVDEGVLFLPVEAFTGQTMTGDLQALEQEWKAALVN